MRKVKGLILMMMAVALTACSSDDESAPLTVNALAGDLAGEYRDNRLVLDYTFKHAGSLVGTIHFEGIRK